MLPPVASSLEDEQPLELLELLPAGELLLAGDWPPDIGEPPTIVPLRHSPEGHVALELRCAQVPFPHVQ